MIKAQVAQVPVGPISIEGLMLPDGSFAIGVSQLIGLNLVSQTHATRDVKALLGKGFQLAKAESELNPKPVNILTLPQFSEVVKLAATRGNQAAMNFAIAMMGLSLHQLFCDAFGIEIGSEERQQYLLGELKAIKKEKDYYQKGMIKANMRASQTRKAAAEKRAMIRAFEGFEKSWGPKKAQYREEFYKLAEGKGAVDYRDLDELAPVEVPEIYDF